MIIQDVTQEQMTEFFINDPALCYLGLSDLDLQRLYETKQYHPRENTKYLGLYTKDLQVVGDLQIEVNKLISLVCIELFTEQALTVHFYIPTDLQKKGLALEIQQFLFQYFLTTYPDIKKIITPVPSSCIHVQKSAEKFGMVVEGKITNCMKWRGEMVDLLFYTIPLTGEITK